MAVEIEKLTSTIEVTGEAGVSSDAQLARLARLVAKFLADEARAQKNRREVSAVREGAEPGSAQGSVP
jgi:hypothetical protein